MKSVYSAVWTGSLNKAVCTSSLKGYCSLISFDTSILIQFLIVIKLLTSEPILLQHQILKGVI